MGRHYKGGDALMELDFMQKLNQKINSMDLFAHSVIGPLDEDESISIMAMPGGAESVYFDGIRDKQYQVQVNTKSRNQANCMNALTMIYQKLENLNKMSSDNGSFDFQSISTASLDRTSTRLNSSHVATS